MYLARVYVTLKPTVNDPKGLAIQAGLRDLAYTSVTGVRLGKYLEVKLAEKNEADARKKVDGMCKDLLANMIIEDYRFGLEAVK